MIRRLVFLLALALMSEPALAGDSHDHKDKQKHKHDHKHEHNHECDTLLTSHIRLISSGRDGDVLPTYGEITEFISKKGGLLDQLGYANPKHNLYFVPSDQLAMLATIGFHPLPHFKHGMDIVQGARSAGGVMEFVPPGCPVCSYYSDATKPEYQIPIIFHVAGHNDVAAHSRFFKERGGHQSSASLLLAEKLEKFYLRYDHDQVSQWVQYLFSMTYLQDLTRGSYESIESLRPGQNPYPEKIDHSGEPKGILERLTGLGKNANEVAENPYNDPKKETGLARPTASVIQAIIANLSPDTPRWMIEVAELFEEIHRPYGFMYQTKIMNEGWATFTQILLAAHTQYNGSKDAFDFAQLLGRVAVPSLTNPYWLGLEGWLNQYRRFFERHPEYKDLKLIERDKKFVAYAHEILGRANDHQFIRESLDEYWVEKYDLVLTRQAQDHEYNWDLPPTRPDHQIQNVVVTKDPKRIVMHIADMVADKGRIMPRIVLTNLKGDGGKTMFLNHEVKDDIPLIIPEAAQTLFILAQITGQTVKLQTIKTILPSRRIEFNEEAGYWWFVTVPGGTQPIEIEVTPQGQVRYLEKHAFASQTQTSDFLLNEQHSAELQEVVDSFKEDVAETFNDELKQKLFDDLKAFTKPMDQAMDYMAQPVMGFTQHAPTASKAIIEFMRVVRYRMQKALVRAAAGKAKVKMTKNGVRIKAMPTIPQFSHDHEIAQQLEEHAPPAPLDLPLGDPTRRMEKAKQTGKVPSDFKFFEPLQTYRDPGGVIQLKDQTFKTPRQLAHLLRTRLERVDLADYDGVYGQSPTQLARRLSRLPNNVVVEFTGLGEQNNPALEIARLAVHQRKFSLMTNLETKEEIEIDLSHNHLWTEKDGNSEYVGQKQRINYKTEVLFAQSQSASDLTAQTGREKGVNPGQGRGKKPGDTFWGPKPGQGGGGPGPGEPGEGAQDPTEFVVPLEVYGKYLLNELELPNLKRTAGRAERETVMKADAERKPEGEILWERVVAESAIPRAMAVRMKKIKKLKHLVKSGEATAEEKALLKQLTAKVSRRQLYKEGMRMVTESDYVTYAKEPTPEPEFQAVVEFVVDMSGSMGGRRQEVAKELAFNIEALLTAIYGYDKIEFRYVGFDGRGHELTRDDVFGKFLGGGTRYAAGIEKGKEILEEYPPSRWNRFMFIIGDGEAFGTDTQESMALLNELYPTMSSMGFAFLSFNPWGGTPYQWSNEFATALEGLSNEKEWFGYKDLTDDSQEMVMATIKEFLGKKKNNSK